MLSVEDIKCFDITTPVSKKDAAINSTSSDAYTWVNGKPFDVVEPYVYQGARGVMIWNPTSGATTSSVDRTRTEFKSKTYQFKDDEVHIFKLTMMVHKINWFGSFVLMQQHIKGSNDPTNKTFLTRNKAGVYQILNGMRTTGSSKDPAKELLLDNVDIGKEFSVKYTITKDGLFCVEASQGENKGKTEKQITGERLDRLHIWHLGSYSQIDKGNPAEPVGDGTLAELIEASEYHGDVPPVIIIPPIELPTEPVLSPYEKAALSLDTTEKEYYTSLKALQRSVKEKLNVLTDELDILQDKDQKAPLYGKIKVLKSDMAKGMAR